MEDNMMNQETERSEETEDVSRETLVSDLTAERDSLKTDLENTNSLLKALQEENQKLKESNFSLIRRLDVGSGMTTSPEEMLHNMFSRKGN